MSLLKAEPGNPETTKEDTAIDHESSSLLEDLSKAAFSRTRDIGIEKLIEDLQEAFKKEEPVTIGAVLQSSNKRLLEESQRTQTAAVSSLDIADLLSGKPLTPISEELWLRLLDTLTPGPYAPYLLQRIASVDINESGVESYLKELQHQWNQDYGSKIMYKSDLEQLDAVVSGEKPSWLKALIKKRW